MYFGILEVDTIKQAKMKEKGKKSLEVGSFSKLTLAAEVSSKSSSLCKIHGTILKMDNGGGTQKNEPKDKEIDDYVPEIWEMR